MLYSKIQMMIKVCIKSRNLPDSVRVNKFDYQWIKSRVYWTAFWPSKCYYIYGGVGKKTTCASQNDAVYGACASGRYADCKNFFKENEQTYGKGFFIKSQFCYNFELIYHKLTLVLAFGLCQGYSSVP